MCKFARELNFNVMNGEMYANMEGYLKDRCTTDSKTA